MGALVPNAGSVAVILNSAFLLKRRRKLPLEEERQPTLLSYGQRFFLEKRGEGTCQLVCTDGTLSMPDCVLVFEENGYV